MPNPQVPNFNPGSGRLAADRFDFQNHTDGYGFRHEASDIDLEPPVLISTSSSNVRDAIVQLRDALTVPIVPDATTVSKGIIQLVGDIGGTATSVSVIAIRGFPVSATPPTTNYVLTWNGSAWTPGPISGSFTFAGDVTGTASATTVVKINGKPVSSATPGTGDVLLWNGSTWLPSHITPTGTGFAHVTSGSFDTAATANIRYTGGKLQTDANIQFKNATIFGDLSWTPTSSNKTLTLPDITDVLVTRTNTETLTNKTVNATDNTITDTSTAVGDLFVSNGTKFVRRAQGGNGTFWGVVGGVAGYYTPGGLSVSGTGFITATSSAVDPTATANIRYIGGQFQTDTDIQWLNGAITGDLAWTPTSSNKTLTLPDATDTLTGRNTIDILTNKTINATNNVITDASIDVGDLLKSNGTKFVRFAKGSSSQIVNVNSGGTDLEWRDPSLKLRITRAFPSDANYTAVATDYRAEIMEFTGAITVTRDVVVPLTSGYKWIVFNGTSGGQSIRIIGATGTGITIANGMRATVYADGTNIVRATADV